MCLFVEIRTLSWVDSMVSLMLRLASMTYKCRDIAVKIPTVHCEVLNRIVGGFPGDMIVN